MDWHKEATDTPVSLSVCTEVNLSIQSNQNILGSLSFKYCSLCVCVSLSVLWFAMWFDAVLVSVQMGGLQYFSFIGHLWTIDITSDTKTNSWGDRRSGNPCKGTPCINKQNIIRSKQWYINHGCFSGEWKRCVEAPTQPPAIWVRCRHCLCVPCYDLLCAILNKGPLWSSQCSGTAGDQCCLYLCTMVCV